MPLEIQDHAITQFKAEVGGKYEPRGPRHDITFVAGYLQKPSFTTDRRNFAVCFDKQCTLRLEAVKIPRMITCNFNWDLNFLPNKILRATDLVSSGNSTLSQNCIWPLGEIEQMAKISNADFTISDLPGKVQS